MRIKKTQVHGNKPEMNETSKVSVSDSKQKVTKASKESNNTKPTPKSPTRAKKDVQSEVIATTKENNKSVGKTNETQSESNVGNAQKQEKSKINEQSKVAKESKLSVTNKNDDKANTTENTTSIDKSKKKIKSSSLLKKAIGSNTNKTKTSSASLLKHKINIMKKKKTVGANKKSLSERNQKKISNELKNLGIDILLDGPKGFGLKQTTDVEDCKTSICESVKTKSRSTVSATMNYVPFLKTTKIKSGQNKANSVVSSDENTTKKESDTLNVKEDSTCNVEASFKEDNNKKKSDSVNNKQEDENNKKVKGNETPTDPSKEGAPKKNDEQIDSLIKKGTTNVKKVNTKKNNGKGNVKETETKTSDKLSNNEVKMTENDKNEKKDDDDDKGTQDKSLDPKKKSTKVKRKYVKKSVQQKTDLPNKKDNNIEIESKPTDTQSNTTVSDVKSEEKSSIETPISRPDSTTPSIGSCSSKDVFEFSGTSQIRPIMRREPIFKHKARLKAEAAQREQLLQGPSPIPQNITKSENPTKLTEDKKEVELIVVDTPNKNIDSSESDKKQEIKDPLSIKSSSDQAAEKIEKSTVIKKPTTPKKVNAKSKVTSTATAKKDETETDESDSEDKKKQKQNVDKKSKEKSKLIKKSNVIKKGQINKKPIKVKSKPKPTDSDESEDDDNDSESSDSSVITRIQKRRAAKTRHMKKYGFWSGPKRHREASLNALAKVHCLYENESRSALEQNLIKAAKLESLKEMQKVRMEMKKKEKDEEEGDESKSSKNEKSSDESEQEEVEEFNKRSVRTASGIRAVGKFWENDESGSSDQESIAQKKSKLKKIKVKEEKDSSNIESQPNKKKLTSKSTKPVTKQVASKKKVISKVKTNVPLKKRPILHKSSESENSESSETDSEDDTKNNKKNESKDVKRKRNNSTSSMDFKNVVTKKRMASLNATAMLAATYEVERAIDRQLSEQSPKQEKADKLENNKKTDKDEKASGQEKTAKDKESGQKTQKKKVPKKDKTKIKSKESDKEKEGKEQDVKEPKEPKPKKEPKELKRVKQEKRDSPTKIKNMKHEADEPIRPVSTSVVIVQDTDVTITGVYVNSTQGANQEAYCKMQYRVQSSVTEERVVRPATNEPPKSYTPLNAIASMRPPVEQMNPIHYGQPPMCDSPYNMDRNNYPPPPSAVPTSSSAFCTPMPPHHDPNSGK
uniref:CSON007002 protein n=1 Tax=Culicoides sonorensis TaxID=179676 RepID=A0A336MUB5_CULSO